jgi:SAM-dependent methyltransferase
MEEYYRRRAAEYDAVYAKPERQADLRSLRQRLSVLLWDRRVLEVAAGTGWWTDAYCDGARQVVATDINSSTLDVARSRRAWPAYVHFTEADAFDLAGSAGLDGPKELKGRETTYDAAFAGFFWSHLAARSVARFLDSVSACLVPGALLVLIDNRYVPASNRPISRTDDEGNTYQERFLADGSRWEVLKNFPSPDEVARRLGRIGDGVTVETYPFYWIASVTVAERKERGHGNQATGTPRPGME